MKPRKHKYGNASQVKCYSDGGKVAKKGNKKRKPKPEMLGTGMAADAGRKLKGREQQLKDKEKELGLNDGGKVLPKKPPMKPPEKGGTPKRITTPGKPGDTGPWGATPARDRQKPKRK